MHRFLLVGGLLTAFVLGLLAGGVLPVAKADTKPVANNGGDPRAYSDTTPYYIQQPFYAQRWEVMILPAPNAGEGPLAILLDTQTGTSFVLRRNTGVTAGYTWYQLDGTAMIRN